MWPPRCDFLRGRGLGPIALMGISMGGSVAIMAAPDLPVAAVVADAAYAELRNPIANRMRDEGYPFTRLGAGLVVAAASLRARVRLRSPINRVGADRPTWAAAHLAGRRSAGEPAPVAALFRAAGEPKELFVVAGAAHAEAHLTAPEAYERRVLDFLARHLDGERPYNRADLYPSSGSRMATRVLVVDDDLNIQRVLVFALKQEGYEVMVASDGAAGVEMALDAKPDLILMDVAMPKLDGYAATQQIRAVGEGEWRAGADHHAHLRGGRGAARQGAARRRRRRHRQAVPPARADGPHQGAAGSRGTQHAQRPARSAPTLGKLCAFYPAKGGVGTTTIAINTAIALARELKRRTALIDANLQFGDLRVFLDLGLDTPSIVNAMSEPDLDLDLLPHA